MIKVTAFALSILLTATNAIAAPTTSLDAEALAKTILNMHKLKISDKGSFAIVYGGQDISRRNAGEPDRFGTPVLVG